MGSPPIPDRGVVPRGRSPAAASSSRIPGRSPPRPHPGIRPAAAPSAVTFTPPKRRTGGSIKGKERALGDDDRSDDDDDQPPTARDDDFPPQIEPTYRHVLGQGNGGAANPLRVIAHVDIDAAYAAMEMARLSIPADQPMAVQQWNGLIAVNYPARAYGITRHEAPAEALKKCPHIRLVHCQTYKNGETEPGYWDDPKPETHKISLDMYRKESRKILAVFSEFCPVVEKASIDESFLDLTLPVRQLLLERYPSLSALPSGATLDEPLPAPVELGITRDSVPWADLCNLVPFAGQKQDKIKRLDAEGAPVPASSSSPVKPSALDLGADDGEDDDGEPPLSWSDVALSLGALLVGDIRNAVRARLGYTCSAGIATNKMLAKLTSAWKKPNAQTVLRHCAVPAFLRPMGFQKIRNLGGKLGNAVKETYEAETVGDLLRFSLPELKAKLGDSSGTWLWEIVRGLDYTEVDTKTQVKSMISSKNFRPSVSKYGEVMHWLNILATELHLRLLDARAESAGLWPKTITFTHRSPSFVIRSHQAPFPFTSSLSIAYILRAADKLLRAALSSSSAPTPAHGNAPSLSSESPVGPYSNMMLSFSGLERLEDGQRGIEGFFAAQQARGTASGAGGARAASVGAGSVEGKVKREVEGPEGEDGRAEKRRRRGKGKALEGKGSSSTTVRSREPTIEVLPNGTEALVLSSSEDDEGAAPPSRRAKRPRAPTYTCARCARVLSVPDGVAERGGEDEVREALEREKAEHADWHVARDLVETERKESGWSLGGATSRSSASSVGSKGKKVKGSSTSALTSKEGTKRSKKEKKRDEGTLNGFLRRE
ncbi:hypothetical protein JCM8208_007082 [Rhodotorula glutinis]